MATEQDPLIKANTEASYETDETTHDSTEGEEQERRKVKRIGYSAKNHVQVIFQMYGSALPSVLPFCILNVVWTLVVFYLRKHGVCDMTFESQTGHSFMGLLVSFLVVSRSSISYQRFMNIRNHMSETFRSCRELVQFACVYTYRTKTEKGKEWRNDVAYRTILLLRVTMDTLRWSSEHIENWEQTYEAGDEQTRRMSGLAHGERTTMDQVFKAPTMFSHLLREKIMQHPDYLGYTMPVNEYRDLCMFVTSFNKAFHGFRVLVFTPYPFPLVQMSRIFLFFWVYSLPLVLLKQLDSVANTAAVIFLISFGFIGTEYVSMMLDDPFSSDTSNIDEQGISELVFEDIYLSLWRVDGEEAATKVKNRVMERYRLGRGFECFQHDMKASDWHMDSEAEV